MINIDKYAYSSKLKKINPMEKFVFAILTLIVCLFADRLPVSIAVFLIMGVATLKFSGTPKKVYFKLLLVPMAFLIIGVLTITINFSKDPSIFFFKVHILNTFIGVSKYGLYKALGLFFKVLGSVSCLYFLSLSTPMVDILSVLEKLKVPKLMIEMMGLVYKFIFILLDTANTMFTAQNSRLGYMNLRSGYRSLGALASTLFIRSFKRANDLYISLESRGYDGELTVLQEPYKKSGKIYIAAIVINVILIVIALMLKY